MKSKQLTGFVTNTGNGRKPRPSGEHIFANQPDVLWSSLIGSNSSRRVLGHKRPHAVATGGICGPNQKFGLLEEAEPIVGGHAQANGNAKGGLAVKLDLQGRNVFP